MNIALFINRIFKFDVSIIKKSRQYAIDNYAFSGFAESIIHEIIAV